MKKLKIVKAISSSLLIVSSVLILNPIGVSAEWKQDSIGWWNTEGNSWSVGWKEVNGNWYYFGQNGYMVHDTIINGYKIGSDGAWIQSTQNSLLSSSDDKEVITSDFTSDQFVNSMKTKVTNIKVEEVESVEENFLPTTSKIITIGDEQINVYIYNSNNEMEKDSLNIDKSGFEYSSSSVNGDVTSTNAGWISNPHFYKKGSIIVQYIGKNEEIISYLKDILGEQFAGK